jgi:cytidine deaminase
MIDDKELIRRATEVVNPRRLSPTVEVAGVGSAVVTDNGNVYVGICIDTACSLGFCAEHNAIGSMITAGESKIMSIVAVNWEGKILAPCGRCRELIYQLDATNAETRVLLQNGRVVRLKELLPEH